MTEKKKDDVEIQDKKSSFSTTIWLIIITAISNAVVVGLATYIVSRNSISLSEEHNLVTSLIPILTSDDGIKVRLGIDLLEESLPAKAEKYKKIIQSRISKTVSQTLKPSTGQQSSGEVKKERKVISSLSKDPEFKKQIESIVEKVQEENKQLIQKENKEREFSEELKKMIALGYKRLQDKECFQAYIVFDEALSKDPQNVQVRLVLLFGL